MPRRALRRAAVVGGVAAVSARAGAKRGAAAAQQQAPAAPPEQGTPQPVASEATMDSKAADLTQLKELLDTGVLTQDEFDAQKARILAS
jgi:membrane protease subunit (stomatin/prohibitin family)